MGTRSDRKTNVERTEMANRLSEIRKKAGQTQESFSEKLKISPSAYKKLETGQNRISVDTLRQLEEFKVGSADYMLFGARGDADEIWQKILNCSEEEKLRLLLRMLTHFVDESSRWHKDGVKQIEYSEIIDDFLKELKRRRTRNRK